jgi:hypothetical protein
MLSITLGIGAGMGAGVIGTLHHEVVGVVFTSVAVILIFEGIMKEKQSNTDTENEGE